MRQLLTCALAALLVAGACAGAVSAQKRTARKKPVEDPARTERRAAATDLVDRAAASALDPRRGAAGLTPAARAAGLAWRLDATAGRAMFGRVLDRAEGLLGDDGESDAVARALPGVLAAYAVWDADAARREVERFARADRLATEPGIRLKLLAALAESLAESNPEAAGRMIQASFEQPGFDPRSWTSIRALEGDAARGAIESGLASFERGAPTLANLFAAATFAQVLVFSETVELDANGTPQLAGRWLQLVVRRLEALRLSIVEARSTGASLGTLADDVALAAFLSPKILAACERWYPEGLQTARVAANEIALAKAKGNGASPPAPQAGAAADGGSSKASDDAAIDRAYRYAFDEREADARREVAAIVREEARAGVADEVRLILASRAMAGSRWSDVSRHLAAVADRGVRVRALGAAAAALAEAGTRDVAEELAVEAVRVAGREAVGYGVAAGLVDASIMFERIGDGTRSVEALRAALKVLVRTDAAGEDRTGCRCWSFVPVPFGAVTVSTGLRVGIGDVALGDALGRVAKRDLVGAVSLAKEPDAAVVREAAELELADALIAAGV